MNRFFTFPKPLVALAFSVAAIISGAAQTADKNVALPAQCADRLLSYRKWKKVGKLSFTLDLNSKNGGGIFYYGAEHLNDPQHRQFQEIEAAWAQIKPDVAFYEGSHRPIFDTRDETIQKTGESGFVRFLAQRSGTRFITLEPSPADEVKHILQKYSFEQTMLFFVLRETARLRERQKLSAADLKKAVAQMFARAAKIPGLEEFAALDIVKLEDAYRRYWKTPSNWWEAPQDWFDPLRKSAATGGIFTNDINRRSSEFRNRYMYETLAKEALAGRRVFAVVGRNHVPMQAEAIRCALQ